MNQSHMPTPVIVPPNPPNIPNSGGGWGSNPNLPPSYTPNTAHSPGSSQERRSHRRQVITTGLLAGIIGYYFGRKHGRRKQKAEMLPIQKRLESERDNLQFEVNEGRKQLQSLKRVRDEQDLLREEQQKQLRVLNARNEAASIATGTLSTADNPPQVLPNKSIAERPEIHGVSENAADIMPSQVIEKSSKNESPADSESIDTEKESLPHPNVSMNTAPAVALAAAVPAEKMASAEVPGHDTEELFTAESPTDLLKPQHPPETVITPQAPDQVSKHITDGEAPAEQPLSKTRRHESEKESPATETGGSSPRTDNSPQENELALPSSSPERLESQTVESSAFAEGRIKPQEQDEPAYNAEHEKQLPDFKKLDPSEIKSLPAAELVQYVENATINGENLASAYKDNQIDESGLRRVALEIARGGSPEKIYAQEKRLTELRRAASPETVQAAAAPASGAVSAVDDGSFAHVEDRTDHMLPAYDHEGYPSSTPEHLLPEGEHAEENSSNAAAWIVAGTVVAAGAVAALLLL